VRSPNGNVILKTPSFFAFVFVSKPHSLLEEKGDEVQSMWMNEIEFEGKENIYYCPRFVCVREMYELT